MLLRPSAAALVLAAMALVGCGNPNEPGLASCTLPDVGAVPLGTSHPSLTSVEATSLSGTPFAVAIGPSGTVVVTRFLAASAVRAVPPSTSFSPPLNVGALPSQVRLSPDGGTAYINNQDNGTITFVNMAANQVVATVPVSDRSILSFGLSPDGARLYALTDFAGVVVLETATRRVIGAIPPTDTVLTGGGLLPGPSKTRTGVGRVLTGVAFHPVSPCMYVAARDEGKIRTVDLRTNLVVHTDSVVGARIQNVAVSRDGSTLYATDIERSKLLVRDLTTPGSGYAVHAVGAQQARNAFDVAVTPDNAQVYVSTLATGRIHVFDRSTLAMVDSVVTGGSARYIAFTPTGSGFVVPNEAGFVTFSPAGPPRFCGPQTPPGVTGHPTLQYRETVGLNGTPFGVAVSGAGLAYVTQLGSGTAVRADLPAARFGSPFAVGPIPSQIRMHPDGQTAYVGNQDARTITFVSVATSQPFDTVAVPNGSILTIGLSPDGSRLYALMDSYGVYILNTSTRALIDSIPAATTGGLLTGVAFHPSSSYVYLAARDAGTVTVVNTQTLAFVRSYTVPGGRMQNVAVSLDGTTLFGTDIERSKLIIWNLTSGSSTFQQVSIGTPGFQRAFDVAVTPDNAQVYVTALGDGRIYVFNRTTLAPVDSVVTGGDARYIAFRPDGTCAVISNEAGWVNFLH